MSSRLRSGADRSARGGDPRVMAAGIVPAVTCTNKMFIILAPKHCIFLFLHKLVYICFSEKESSACMTSATVIVYVIYNYNIFIYGFTCKVSDDIAEVRVDVSLLT